MLIYGHRGASRAEPENTLRAFRKAIEEGVDGLELDVHATLDRVPVVIHDRDLARTTNASGAIDRMRFEELAAVDAGKDERIPRLEEILASTEGKAHLDIEIKQGGIEREVLDVLGRFPDARWAISSFDWTVLERARAISHSAELWLIGEAVSEAMQETASRVRAAAISLYSGALNAETAARLKDAGLEIVVWTVNELDEAKRVRDLGADAICTDVPKVMIAGLV